MIFCLKKVLIIVFLFPYIATSQIITTVAGDGIEGTSGDGGAAIAARLVDPHGGVFDNYGNLYIVEGTGHKIRKVDAITGIITTVVGTGSSGYNGDGIPATTANITPNAIAIDTAGNLYITDSGRIRKVDMTTGIITTIAGGGTVSVGDGLPATEASLYPPWGLCFDKQGNLYFGETIGYRLRKINTSGILSTVVGNGIAGFSGDGGPDTMAQCGQVFGVCVDNIGNIYFADYIDNERVRKVDTSGIITTVAGTGTYSYNGDAIPATTANIDPLDVKVDIDNNLYIVDLANSRIRKVDTFGIIYTITGTGINGYNGDGILADTAKIYDPGGLAIDVCNNVYFGDINNARFRKVAFPPNSITLTDILAASTADSICTSTSVTYTASATTSSGTISYQWYVDGSVVSTAGNTLTYTPANGDSIRCVVTAANSCTSAMMSSNTINMTVSPVTVPTITVTAPASALAGSVVDVTATVTGAGSSYSIKWYDNGLLFNTTSVPVTTYVQDTGTDVITATVIPTGETCSDTANSNAVSVSVGNEEAPSISPQGGGLSVFPSPVGDVLNIVGQDIAKVTVSNVPGQVVFTTPFPLLKTGVLHVVMAPFASGVYVVEVTEGDGVRSVVKVVKE